MVFFPCGRKTTGNSLQTFFNDLKIEINGSLAQFGVNRQGFCDHALSNILMSIVFGQSSTF